MAGSAECRPPQGGAPALCLVVNERVGQIVSGGPRRGAESGEAKPLEASPRGTNVPMKLGGGTPTLVVGKPGWRWFERAAISNRTPSRVRNIPLVGRRARMNARATGARIAPRPPASAPSTCANGCGIAPLTLRMRTSRARVLTNTTCAKHSTSPACHRGEPGPVWCSPLAYAYLGHTFISRCRVLDILLAWW
jgi:hypothetical protein